jgi:hypothetical protein
MASLLFLLSSFSYEHQFLLVGLKVEKKPIWEECQQVYFAAIKKLHAKLKLKLSTLPVTLSS